MMRIIAVFVLLIVAEMATAQPYFNIGVRGGGNSSSITFIPRIRDEVASISGYQIGASFQYVNIEHLGIQLDPMLINQGWRQIADDQTQSTFRINFLHLPLTTYAYVGRKNTRFFANAGLYVNIRMDGTRTVTTPNGASQTFNYNYQSGRDNPATYGLTGGGGLSYNTGYGTVGADIRISYTFSNIMRPEIPTRDFSRDQVLAITGFYQFTIKKRR
jgi:hypothetical protein